MKKIGTILMTVVFVLGCTSFASAQITEKDKKMKNPIENTKETLKEGKAIFDMHCKACHGAKGLGDGPKAKSMKGDFGDFSSAKFESQTDAELFYIIKEGKGDHPSFAKKLSDEDKWLSIIYVRSLKK